MFICLLSLLALIFYAGPLLGAQYEEDVSTKEYLFVKAIINSVSLEEQTVKIKVKKGPTIVLVIDKNTIFEGFYKLQELKARETVKVWYQPKPPTNRALKILKPLDLGC
jgi:hypothetical protein